MTTRYGMTNVIWRKYANVLARDVVPCRPSYIILCAMSTTDLLGHIGLQCNVNLTTCLSANRTEQFIISNSDAFNINP